MIKPILILFFAFLPNAGFSQSSCYSPAELCPAPTTTFDAVTGGSFAFQGPSYGCLGTQPRPTWLYIHVYSGGSLQMLMTAPYDIDFICWGPFTSLAGSCDSLTSAKIVDCSYSASATETLSIPYSNNGDYFIVMISNFNGSVQTPTISQLPGSGILSCTSLSLTSTQTVCAGKTATISAQIQDFLGNYFQLDPGSIISYTPLFYVFPTGSTIYTLTATGTNLQGNMVTFTAAATISVVANPTVTINGPDTLCLGDTISLTASGAEFYVWSSAPGDTNSVSIVTPTANGIYTVAGKMHSGCYSSASHQITVISCNYTGAENNSRQITGLKLFPNPVKDILYVEGIDEHASTTVYIYDLHGFLIAEEMIKSGNKLNFSQFEPGLYLIRFRTANTIFTSRIIKESR